MGEALVDARPYSTRLPFNNFSAHSRMPQIAPSTTQSAKHHRHWFARAAFYAHLWLGVLFKVALLSISVGGFFSMTREDSG